jgi:hypothetical protein
VPPLIAPPGGGAPRQADLKQQSDVLKLGLKYFAVKRLEDVVVGAGAHRSGDLNNIVFKDTDDDLRLCGAE